MSKFTILPAPKGKWYMHLRASNGRIIIPSETYNRLQGALKVIAAIKREAPGADVFLINRDGVKQTIATTTPTKAKTAAK